MVHWPLMGGLLHLVQRGGDWTSCGPAQSPPCCTKCNSPPINYQCTNFVLFDITFNKNTGTHRDIVHDIDKNSRICTIRGKWCSGTRAWSSRSAACIPCCRRSARSLQKSRNCFNSWVFYQNKIRYNYSNNSIVMRVCLIVFSIVVVVVVVVVVVGMNIIKVALSHFCCRTTVLYSQTQLVLPGRWQFVAGRQHETYC